MNTTTISNPPVVADTATDRPEGHDWHDAGDAWGSRARDWACLFESYANDTILAIIQDLQIGADTSLLDVACGSGLAVRIATATGATTAGIDAAEPLIDIARARTPDADLRVGDMFALPWEDESFDVVTSINGIWGGCEAALAEAYRVLRPGGSIAISFWGDGHLDFKPCFVAFALNAPSDHLDGMRRTNRISRPGTAEAMLESVGFVDIERDSRVSVVEWADADTAWRALSSVGPAVPALEAVGEDVLRPQVMESVEQLRDEHGIIRFRNDHQFVVAHKR